MTWDGRPADPSEIVDVHLDRLADGSLRILVDAPFHDDPPPPGEPGPTPALWNYEVVELFVAESSDDPDTVRYLEVELSPHGHHLVLRFEGVRRAVEEGLPLKFRARIDRAAGRWTGEAEIPSIWLPPRPRRVNAFAIHGVGERRRYLIWSALPVGDAPDFHQPHLFTDAIWFAYDFSR